MEVNITQKHLTQHLIVILNDSLPKVEVRLYINATLVGKVPIYFLKSFEYFKILFEGKFKEANEEIKQIVLPESYDQYTGTFFVEMVNNMYQELELNDETTPCFMKVAERLLNTMKVKLTMITLILIL